VPACSPQWRTPADSNPVSWVATHPWRLNLVVFFSLLDDFCCVRTRFEIVRLPIFEQECHKTILTTIYHFAHWITVAERTSFHRKKWFRLPSAIRFGTVWNASSLMCFWIHEFNVFCRLTFLNHYVVLVGWFLGACLAVRPSSLQSVNNNV
jgi:hypothetical protein